MKSVLIFILATFVSSCCGTKKTIETQPKPTKEIAVVTQAPDTVETSPVLEPLEAEEVQNTIEEEPIIEHETTFEYFDHFIWKQLLSSNVSDNGKVDYKGFKKETKKLKSYIDSLAVDMPTNEWPKEDKIAYWINAYNALTVDLIIRNYPLNSIKDIKDPWDQRLWKLGDKWYNLNEIEHQVLRKMDEPRIHFAIVCASESCPKLRNRPFYATSLDEDLTDATKEFLSDTSKNELSENRIKISKIFKWFAKDFKQDGTLIDFLNQYSEITISSKAKKSFKDYNWDLNE